jgi:hypothetical protein
MAVLGALLLVPTWPIMTRIRQIAEAIVNAIGVMMHAMRPILPMLAVEAVLLEVDETRKSTSDAAYWSGSDNVSGVSSERRE